MKRFGISAKIRPGLDFPGLGYGYRQVFPFHRHWVAIVVLALFSMAFVIPAVFVFQRAASGWAEFEDLFDLVATVFSSAWLLGWSLAPLIMITILLLMIFGREVVRVRNGVFEIFIGLPLIGLVGKYEPGGIRNLRINQPQEKSGNSWRGQHLQFDYGANDVEFGSNVTHADLLAVQNNLSSLTGQSLRTGDATPEELEGEWEASALEQLSAEPEVVPLAQAAPIAPPPGWPSLTVMALILANLVPVFGTLYLGWDLGDVMVLYWAESAVIGFFNLIKIAVIGRWMALFIGVFFIAHFGGFMAGHFLFIWGIFVKGFEETRFGELNEVAQHFLNLWPALAALFVSHAISFFRNFIGRREYANRKLNDQMMEPYSRIILMHVTIIFGGGLAMILGQTTPVLLIIIAAKIVIDVRAHMKEHRTKL